MTNRSTERFRRDDDPLRQRILEIAPLVLQRVGLARFTMEEVANATGVARQTVYKRFSSRDDLIVSLLLNDVEQRQVPALQPHVDQEPSVHQFVRIFIAEREIGKRYPFIDDVFSPRIGTRIAAMLFSDARVIKSREAVWRPILERYQAAGVVRGDLDMAAAVRWLFYETFWQLTEPELLAQNPDDVEYYTAMFIVQGLLTEPARQELFATIAPRSEASAAATDG